MNLSEFVSNTLCDIMEGVNDAQSKMIDKENDQKPHTLLGAQEISADRWFLIGKNKIGSFVEFDIAINISGAKKTDENIIVFSGLTNTNNSQKYNISNTQLSRIKFQIPIILPLVSSELGNSEATPDIHIVQSGETLQQIAAQHGSSWQDIAAANGIDNPRNLPPGTPLRIP